MSLLSPINSYSCHWELLKLSGFIVYWLGMKVRLLVFVIYNVLTQADMAERGPLWCLLPLQRGAIAATSLFSGLRGCPRSNESDCNQFVLFIEECTALITDVHLERMFCSTRTCAFDVLGLRHTPGDWVFLLCYKFLTEIKVSFKILRKKKDCIHTNEISEQNSFYNFQRSSSCHWLYRKLEGQFWRSVVLNSLILDFSLSNHSLSEN